ncbi:MAG: AmmeMemoRadiSam system radical SAM enzyme [Firmicutes bacterium]|nr:AmmeMemoRadiSam system radical SAM enzyme [Bacillota bacterium]
MPVCEVCFHHCQLKEGGRGVCGARICRDGVIVPENYGKITSLALDPIEKKPLARFYPGSYILSAGSYGCNLHCPFCQNYEIARREEMLRSDASLRGISLYRDISPEEMAGIAAAYQKRGNIGIAFTYNEPLISYEYILDTARLVHQNGMKCVLVTNGTASLDVLEKLVPYIDAMNIDLKGFTDHYYSDVLHGDRQMTMDFIREAVKHCHVELTTLIVPRENDSLEEIDQLASWVASLADVYGGKNGSDIPLHISRFFPRYRMTDRGPTSVRLIYQLAEIARRHLTYVYTGNC